jgi:uncharacterized protein (UPF0147 family)
LSRAPGKPEVAIKDSLGLDTRRVLERAVTNRALEVAGIVVGRAMNGFNKSMKVLEEIVEDNSVSDGVRVKAAIFLAEFNAKILGVVGTADQAAKAINAPLTITMEEVNDRIESDPDFARNLACGTAPVGLRGEATGH